MSTPLNPARPSPRAAVVVAALALSATGGVVAAISMTGFAQADQPAPQISANTVFPTFGTSPPLATVGPQPTFGTGPPLTFVTVVPPNTVPATSTTIDETTTTADTTTTTTTTTAAPTTTPSAGQPSAEPVYTLVIDRAQINCDGTIHVEYTTTAEPALAVAANHIVMYNSMSSPAEFKVVETEGNPQNGSFVFDDPGVLDQTYRLFVIGLFEPAEPDGPKAIDQADVVLVGGC